MCGLACIFTRYDADMDEKYWADYVIVMALVQQRAIVREWVVDSLFCCHRHKIQNKQLLVFNRLPPYEYT
jgi:hypothetical protein